MIKEQKACRHIECENDRYDDFSFCRYHVDGGSLGIGETYEQYQIIESDFLDFIRVVPIDDKEHLKVHSPVLRVMCNNSDFWISKLDFCGKGFKKRTLFRNG